MTKNFKKGDGEESGPKYDAQINPSRNDKKLKAKTDRKQKSATFEIEKKNCQGGFQNKLNIPFSFDQNIT